jgi:hypothetical protein
MLKEKTSLSNFRDKFTEAFIFGSGPTSFDYDVELPKISDPVFFINNTHRLSRLCRSEHQYFFTHHIHKFLQVDPVTIFIQRMFNECGESYKGVLHSVVTPMNKYISVDAQQDDEVASEWFLESFKLRDKDEIERKNRLLACFGSATTAIHFAWFTGCKKVTFVGCNPDLDTDDYDPRISSGKMLFDPKKVKENNRVLPKMLGLNVVHR